jgi:hypothetical protein
MSGFGEEIDFIKSEIEAWLGWRNLPEEELPQRLADTEHRPDEGMPPRFKGLGRTSEKGLLQHIKDVERKE